MKKLTQTLIRFLGKLNYKKTILINNGQVKIIGNQSGITYSTAPLNDPHNWTKSGVYLK